MFSVVMKDSVFHVPVLRRSKCYVRFMFDRKAFQFRALCFGSCPTLQVFTRVLAPLAKFSHLAGVQIFLYLADWLVSASSFGEMRRSKEFVLNMATELGIIINNERSHLAPT